jgi:ribosome recycling factor
MRLELTPVERDELVRLVDEYFQETRVEVRHTQNREFRNQLHREEDVLRGLLERLRNLKEEQGVEPVIPAS